MDTIKQSILCVDDNADSLELLKIIFELEGFEVKTCDSLEHCLPLINENNFKAIILDNWFQSVGTSVEICKEIRTLKPTVPIIYYSAEARSAEIEKALDAGATDYLTKPGDFERLTETVGKYIQPAQAEV